MKLIKAIVIVLTISALAFSFGCNKKLKEQNREMSEQLTNAMDTLNDIQKSLDELKIRESIVQKLDFSTEYPDFIINDQKAQILSSINDIGEFINENMTRLDMLERQLNENNVEMVNLQRMIDNLRRTLNNRETLISELRAQVEDLTNVLADERRKAAFEIQLRDETIASQTGVISQKDEEIARQRLEDNTVYFFINTKDELIKNNFITKSGLFSSSKPTNTYNTEIMHSINLLEFQDIIIQAPINKIKVMSGQDINSYEMISYGTETLFRIKDVEKFRQVKYLIIQKA
jgi:hypothetical protein